MGYEFNVVGTRKVKIFGDDVPLVPPHRIGEVAERQFILEIDGEEHPIWLKTGTYEYDISTQRVVIHWDTVFEENLGDISEYINKAIIIGIE